MQISKFFMSSSENTYSNAAYNAQKVAILSYYDAAIDELTQTLDLESKQKADEAMYCNLLATTQAEIIDNLFEDLEEIDPDDDDGITNWLGTLGTTGATATSVLSTENSARSGRNSTNTTTLNNLKATLKTERETKEAAADRLYRNTEQNSWNDYLTSIQSANTVYLSSIKNAENTYKTASDAAESTFDTTTITAYTNYHQSIHALDTAFYAAVADADDPNFTTTAYFTTTGANPNLPYQKTALANTSKAVDHEDCPYCHGKGTYTVSTGGMGMVGLVWTGGFTTAVCDHQPPAITSSEQSATNQWTIKRSSESTKADVSFVRNSTIEELADEIGLNLEEHENWLTRDDALYPRQIPNTIISILYDDLTENDGMTNIHRGYWTQYNEDLRSLGFYVLTIDAAKHSTAFTLAKIKEFSSNKELHGLAIFGHGNEKQIGTVGNPQNPDNAYPKNFITFSDGENSIKARLSYQLAALVLYACKTKSESSQALVSNSINAIYYASDHEHNSLPWYKDENFNELRFPHISTFWGSTSSIWGERRGGKQHTNTFLEWQWMYPSP